MASQSGPAALESDRGSFEELWADLKDFARTHPDHVFLCADNIGSAARLGSAGQHSCASPPSRTSTHTPGLMDRVCTLSGLHPMNGAEDRRTQLAQAVAEARGLTSE